MCLLFKFSKYLLVPLVTDWLDLYDFVLLSSSCSFSKVLGELHSYPQKVNAFFDSSLPLTNRLISWLNRRKLYPLLNIQLDEALLNVFQSETVFRSFLTYIYGSEKDEQKRNILSKRHYIRGMTVNCSIELDAQVISSITSNFTKIQELTLTRQSATYKKMSNWMNSSFINLLHLCPLLRKLHVDDVIVFPDSMFFVLVVWCRQLESLTFPNRFMNVQSWCRSQLIYALHSGRPSTTAVIPENGALVLKTLLAYSGRAIQTVTIFECYSVFSHLQYYGFDLSSITSLHMDYKHDSQLLPLREALPGLRELHINSVHKSANVIPLLTSGLPIVHLKCNMIPAECANCISSDCCVQLTSLDLSYYAYLKDEVLGLVASLCTSLTQLNLSYNSLITDEGVLTVIAQGRLVRLNVMITHLTPRTLLYILQHCPRLVWLGLSVSIITEQDMLDFVGRCSTLRELFCYVFKTTTPSLDQQVRKINSRVKVYLETSRGAATGR